MDENTIVKCPICDEQMDFIESETGETDENVIGDQRFTFACNNDNCLDQPIAHFYII